MLLEINVREASRHSFHAFQVCYNQRCQDIKSLTAYSTSDCSSQCSNRGVGNVSWASQATVTVWADLVWSLVGV